MIEFVTTVVCVCIGSEYSTDSYEHEERWSQLRCPRVSTTTAGGSLANVQITFLLLARLFFSNGEFSV